MIVLVLLAHFGLWLISGIYLIRAIGVGAVFLAKAAPLWVSLWVLRVGLICIGFGPFLSLNASLRAFASIEMHTLSDSQWAVLISSWLVCLAGFFVFLKRNESKRLETQGIRFG